MSRSLARRGLVALREGLRAAGWGGPSDVVVGVVGAQGAGTLGWILRFWLEPWRRPDEKIDHRELARAAADLQRLRILEIAPFGASTLGPSGGLVGVRTGMGGGLPHGMRMLALPPLAQHHVQVSSLARRTVGRTFAARP